MMHVGNLLNEYETKVNVSLQAKNNLSEVAKKIKK